MASFSTPPQTHHLENQETSEADLALRGRGKVGRSGKVRTQDLHAQRLDKAAYKFRAAESDSPVETLVDKAEEAVPICCTNTICTRHKPKVVEPKLGEFEDYKGHMSVIGTLRH
ncbi:hypothetical protein DL546_005300 [Coniochaeta pulveracea]|uniref:Uncharacterized protein n=1 Tax=Coniochaeta pulveracea TaxID=177199 RepID=A0A420Y384_9PEZI|nr:hypothetical protein DL546_005300 [Coniochaeta pulveracea]